MFRDSRGVVHTVRSIDPLDDLPAAAADILRRELLTPVRGDLGGALERCEAVAVLLDRWQDAFFAALPIEVDRDEEARWAAEAGLSLEDIEDDWEQEGEDDPQDCEEPVLAPEAASDTELDEAFGPGTAPVPDELVAELERALLLLPLRVRLEALVAAGALVEDWAELLADHEKALGHLVLGHGEPQTVLAHEELVDRHAVLHQAGPGHP